MNVLLANHSTYPAVGAADRGTASGGEAAALGAIIAEQEALGFDLVTDGMAQSVDPATASLEGLDGVRFGPRTPFFERLPPIRQPVIEAKIRHRHGRPAADYHRARPLAHAPLKAVITGPYTLARIAAITTTAYRGVSDLAADLAAALATDVAELVAAGAPFIQVDEPAICRHPEDIRLLRELLEPLQIACGGAAVLAVATPGGDAEPLYAQLNSLPAEVLALDVAASPRLVETVAAAGASKMLAFGLLDRPDAVDGNLTALTRTLERLLHRYVHATAYLQPARGLGGLTPAEARATLARLADARRPFQASCS